MRALPHRRLFLACFVAQGTPHASPNMSGSAIESLRVFALDMHASLPFVVFNLWMNALPYDFDIRYYTAGSTNKPARYAEPRHIVDGHTLEREMIYPWSSPSVPRS